MKMKLLSMVLAAALLGSASSLSAQEVRHGATSTANVITPDPAVEIYDLARSFRAADVSGLVQRLTPRSTWAKVRIAFEVHRNKPTSETDRAHFSEKIREFTAPDAVDRLMARIEPKLVEARPQFPGMVMMAIGGMNVAVRSSDNDLTDDQRKMLERALPGIGRWISSTDFLSSDSMRRALTLLTDAARNTGITDVDQLKALPLEGVLERASPMLVAAKNAVRIYGIDLDAVADSLKVDVLERGNDTARVRTTVTVFGAPVWCDHDLVLIEGHWYGKHVVTEFKDVDIDELEG